MLSVRLNEHHHLNGNSSSTSLNDIDNSLLNSSESNRGTKTMKSSHSTLTDYGHTSSSDNIPGRFSSALNRIKYSYDYKPLMRTITRRFDSPTKVLVIIFLFVFTS